MKRAIERNEVGRGWEHRHVEIRGPSPGVHWGTLIQEETDLHLWGIGQHGRLGWAWSEIAYPSPLFTLPSLPSPLCLMSNRLRKKWPREEPSTHPPPPPDRCDAVALRVATWRKWQPNYCLLHWPYLWPSLSSFLPSGPELEGGGGKLFSACLAHDDLGDRILESPQRRGGFWELSHC